MGYFDSQGELNFKEIQLPTTNAITDIKYVNGYSDYTFKVAETTTDYLFGYYIATSGQEIFISRDGLSWAKYAKPSATLNVIAAHYETIVLASQENYNKTGNLIEIKFIPIIIHESFNFTVLNF